jgi:hypothetical protein
MSRQFLLIIMVCHFFLVYYAHWSFYYRFLIILAKTRLQTHNNKLSKKNMTLINSLSGIVVHIQTKILNIFGQPKNATLRRKLICASQINSVIVYD